MLTFKQYLNEVLNNPYKWEFEAENSSNDYFMYKFTTKPGVPYRVKLYSQDQYWELSFNIDFNYITKLGKGVDDSFKISGTGDQFRIFATIQDIIKDFITKKNPNVIQFDAAEPSRRRLYSTFTANFEKSHPELFKTYLVWSTSTGADHYIMNRDFAKKVLNGPDNSYFYNKIPSEYRDELR
jgi:hypothetical protein